MITSRDVDIYVNRYGIQATIPVVQYDSGRQFIFRVVDASIPSGSIAYIFIRKPSGKSVYNTCTVLGNTVKVTLTNQSLAEYGINNAQVQINKGGEIVTSFEVIFDVRRSYAYNASESKSESNFFENLASEAQAAAGTYPNAKQINYLFNFEQGTYSTTKDGYKKVDSSRVLRTIVPFFCKKGITLSALSGSQIILQKFDTNLNYVGKTSFVESYTAEADYYIFLAMHKKPEVDISVSDVPEILTSGTIDIITHNAVQSKYTEESTNIIAEDAKAAVKAVSDDINKNTKTNYLFNFEQGTYASITNGYRKVDSSRVLRTIVPFFCKEGTVLSALSGSQIILQKFDTNFNYVGKTSFAESYTAEADYYIFLAMHKKPEVDISVSDVPEILTSETIDIITHNAVLSKYIELSDNISIMNTGSYIRTNVGIGEKVNLSPSDYEGFTCLCLDCIEGDQFTVTGSAGNSGRLWAFVDGDNRLLSKANNISCDHNEVLTAPANSSKVIFNFNVGRPHSLFRGNYGLLDRELRKLLITQAVIEDFPHDVVAMPKLAYKAKIQNKTGVSAAKTAIFKNGDYFCISYGENIDGNSDDFPRVTDSGVLKLIYKFFKFKDETETDSSYGVIAQKGTKYIDYTGAEKSFVGGCGLPSGRNGKQFFTSAYTGTNKYSGIENYGMTPCVCDISVSSSGVTVGTIHEMILVVNGTSGKFDLTRINDENVDYSLYLTTAPPSYADGTWHWIQPAKHGLIYLTSPDAITWTYRLTILTDFDPCCEVTTVMYGKYILAAVRTWGDTRIKYTSSTLYILLIDTGGFIAHQYAIPNVSTRSWLTKSGNEVLLFYNSIDKNVIDCVKISNGSANFSDGLFFNRWFTLYDEGTWYTECNEDTIANTNFTDMYIAGGNDPGPSTANGMTFLHLTFNGNLPHRIADIPVDSIGKDLGAKVATLGLNLAWNNSNDIRVQTSITNFIDMHDLGTFYLYSSASDHATVGAPTEAPYHYFVTKINSATSIIFAVSMTIDESMSIYVKQRYNKQWASNWIRLLST